MSLTENEKRWLGRALLGRIEAQGGSMSRLAANAAVNLASLRAKVLELEASCVQQRKRSEQLETALVALSQRVQQLEAGRGE